MEVELAYASAAQQILLKISAQPGTTIAQAIAQADILAIANIDIPLSELNVGIFGKQKDLEYILQDGDRIEIYRQLHVDPKTARQQRAKKQQDAKRRARVEANIAKKAAKNAKD